MSKTIQINVALVALLMGAALVGHRVDSYRQVPIAFILGLLFFGIVNVLFSPPGTLKVRAFTIAATFVTLLLPGLLGPVMFLAWLVWPPAFMVAWRLGNDSAGPRVGPQEGQTASTRARVAVAALIAAVAVAAFAFRLTVTLGLQQTSALFVGIPSILAIVVVFAVSPRSATGVACKAVTIALLVSMMFLGEGMVCIVMSAPLFYAIAIAIASTMDIEHQRRDTTTITLRSCLVLLAVIPMSLEGVTDFTTVNRDESVAETRIVRASSQAVERALFEPPRFDRVRPTYLRAGFPSPIATRVERSADGMRWVIQIRGGEMRLNGMEARTGDLVLALEESRPGLVRWRAVSDSSHVTHFLNWREIVVLWEPVNSETTKVTWTLRYRRGLDPAWYFGPWERYAVRLAAGYLIDSVATP